MTPSANGTRRTIGWTVPVLVVLAVLVSHPTRAAEIPTPTGTPVGWIWTGPGVTVFVFPLPPEAPAPVTPAPADPIADDDKLGVILDDGAPF